MAGQHGAVCRQLRGKNSHAIDFSSVVVVVVVVVVVTNSRTSYISRYMDTTGGKLQAWNLEMLYKDSLIFKLIRSKFYKTVSLSIMNCID